ncbi:MAG: shikimate dehydrogenase, partial [Chloroflexota bacterium]
VVDAAALGLDAELVGRDIPLGAEPSTFRAVVEELRADPSARGALVTSHKVSIYRHARDLLDEVDRWAELCGEVSCLAKIDGRLVGSANDPISSWQAFVEIAGADYFARHPEAEVLCIGAGGSGTAFTSRLLTVEAPPARIVVTNRSPERLDALREIHRRLDGRVPVEYRAVGRPEATDALLADRPPASVVVNATGLGKDRPGSPLTDAARFPERAIVWDFNYRGELRFLEQARRQAAERGLTVVDGWRYFVVGWILHVAAVFGIELDEARVAELTAIADATRAPAPDATALGPDATGDPSSALGRT